MQNVHFHTTSAAAPFPWTPHAPRMRDISASEIIERNNPSRSPCFRFSTVTARSKVNLPDRVRSPHPLISHPPPGSCGVI